MSNLAEDLTKSIMEVGELTESQRIERAARIYEAYAQPLDTRQMLVNRVHSNLNEANISEAEVTDITERVGQLFDNWVGFWKRDYQRRNRRD